MPFLLLMLISDFAETLPLRGGLMALNRPLQGAGPAAAQSPEQSGAVETRRSVNLAYIPATTGMRWADVGKGRR